MCGEVRAKPLLKYLEVYNVIIGTEVKENQDTIFTVVNSLRQMIEVSNTSYERKVLPF